MNGIIDNNRPAAWRRLAMCTSAALLFHALCDHAFAMSVDKSPIRDTSHESAHAAREEKARTVMASFF
jgi:putative NIF3 family GTP cyclohydrolase 1 type 2